MIFLKCLTDSINVGCAARHTNLPGVGFVCIVLIWSGKQQNGGGYEMRNFIESTPFFLLEPCFGLFKLKACIVTLYSQLHTDLFICIA